MKRKFFFLIIYFKPSGKYYTEAIVEWGIAPIDADPDIAYYADAIAKLRDLRDTGGPGALPGLAGAGWDGAMLIVQATPRHGWHHNHPDSPDDYMPDGVPHLIMPRQ